MKGSGHWFYTTYQQCNRKFWFNKILRFRPNTRAAALSFGTAIHSAVKEFHTSFDGNKAVEVFSKTLDELKTQYDDAERYVSDANRGIILIAEYAKAHAGDQERFDVLLQEEELHVKVGDNYDFIFKPDRISFDKQRRMYVAFEVKTTGYSIKKAYENVFYGDQATAYLFAWNKLHPDKKIEMLVVDVLYNNKGVFSCERPGEVYRTRTDLEQYELGLFGVISEITQKANNLDKFPAIQLFPRRGDCDGDGFYTCEYRSICRQYIDPTSPPVGFHIEEERK